MSKMMNWIRQMCHQYKALAVMGLYAVVYLVAFYYLENRKVAYHIIHFGIDAYIPRSISVPDHNTCSEWP